jgi:hypothetical protein
MARANQPPRRRRQSQRKTPGDVRGARRQAREAALEAAAFKEMVREHWAIPTIGLLAILVSGATRFEESREVMAHVVALGTPLVAMTIAAAPMREAHPTFRALGFATAALVASGAELVLVPAMLPGQALPPVLERLVAAAATPAFPALLVGMAILTVPLEAIAVKRGVGSRFAALAGVVVGLALYLPGHHRPQDPFGSVLVAFLVALFVGGGAGLLLGSLARAATGSRV